jgi:hypothetical protein
MKRVLSNDLQQQFVKKGLNALMDIELTELSIQISDFHLKLFIVSYLS